MPDALLAFSCLLPLLFLITIARKRTQLRVLKKALAAEALEKERVAQDLGALRNEFDRRVDERTLEISLANEVLQRAIEEERHASSLLREREQQFKLACHFGQVATWVWDLNTDEFLVSSSSPGKDGTAPCDHFFAIHNEDRHAVRLSFENARTCASEFGVEFRTLDVDDTVHWVAARGALELREDGPPLRMTGVSIDITARKEAELALAESEKQFEFLADSIPNLAWMAHADGHTFWYNRRWYEYTNTTPEQVSGWGWQSVHHPDELPRVMARWRECIRTGEPFEMEFPLLSGTGVFHWFLTRVTPVYGQEGEIARWFGTNTDVTEIRHAREALRESESHFRQIANSLPQLVWIAGPDGSVQWLNQRWYDFTGSTAEQSEGDGWMQFTHPEDHAWRAENWTHSFSTAALFESESRCRRSDGVYRWFLIRGNPVVGTHGQIVKWFGTYTDVEDYKRAETEIRRLNQGLENRVVERTAELLQANEELRRTQTWLRAVLDSATQASIIAVDNQGIITLFNSGAEKLLGYSARELVGTRAPQIFQTTGTRELPDRPHSSEQPRPAVARLGNPGTDPDGASVFESVYFHRDGTPIEVGVAHTPMVDSHGERLGTLGIALDIRPRKALERRLNQNNIELKEQTRSAQDANRAKSDFLAVMSHEFRTPMNAILGMADLLWESDLEPTQRQYVEVFRRAGANLLTLVNNILDLSKIESGQFELEQIDFELVEVVERTVDIIHPKAKAKHIGMMVRISPSAPATLVGDPTRLQQVLMNLLGNAVKFTEAGEITLTVEADPLDRCRLHFNVTDTGIGIPKDKIETIFSDFTQAESSTTRQYGGTGLGLGICRRLISRMSGELHLSSELGRGSSFRFDALFAVSTHEKSIRSDLAVGVNGCRILIVDNNATNRLIFFEMCAAWGMLPSECADASAAITTLQAAVDAQHPFQLVILDRLMPGLDGFQLVPHIRKVDSAVPIIMATSDKVPGDETRSKQLGLSGYAVKPVRRSELLRLISEALSSKAKPEPIRGEEVVHGTQPGKLLARILIAEDSEDNRFLLRAYLRNQPYEITFVTNGELAAEVAGLHRFDLILMDIQMPVMDGLSATRMIRKLESDRALPQTPILALTANARAEDVAASRSAGCNSHLSKPINKQMLLRAIQENLGTPGAQIESTPFSIDVPEGLEEGAKRYIQSRKNEVSHLIQLLQDQDFGQLKKLGHNMKGTGSSYGFPDLTRLGAMIETSAESQNGAEVSEQLFELSRYVQEAADLMALIAADT